MFFIRSSISFTSGFFIKLIILLLNFSNNIGCSKNIDKTKESVNSKLSETVYFL